MSAKRAPRAAPPVPAPPVDWFGAEVSRVADEAHAMMMRSGRSWTLYLWHRPGGLALAEDAPGPDWMLGYQEAERGGRTRDQLRAWIYRIARSLPCLPPAIAGARAILSCGDAGEVAP